MSKFDKIFEAREQESEVKAEKPILKSGKKAKADAIEKTSTASVQPSQTPSLGRPKAKRSDPNFLGFTTYIRRDTHTKVKIALLQEGEGRELSELVEELLVDWVEKPKS